MDEQRRSILGAVGAAALFSGGVRDASAETGARASPTTPPGSPSDFAFLTGEWRIHHRQLKGAGQWEEFEGEATVTSILGGIVSIEELRIPARNFSGMGLRLFDVSNRVWIDYWVNARSGVLGASGVSGGFVDGAGIFDSDDTDNDHPIKVRGVWDRITPTSCRWWQATSRDGGRTWQENWLMDWVRTSA